MFKALIVYRILSETPDLSAVEEGLAKAQFEECGPTQEKSVGWVPPRGEEHGAMVESIGGHWIARFMSESKVIPGSVLARKVKEKADRIEQETGRKPGKKESKELKEEAKLDLLPHAFTKQASTWVWIDPAARWLVIDASSQSRADDVVTMLVDSIPGFAVALLHTHESPQACMAHWLKEQEPPTGFSIDRECELKSADEAKAVVRYAHHPLDIDEIREHIDQGKLPTKLAMTWDGRVSFVLTEGLQIRKLAFLDTVFDGQKSDDAGFDADVAIATGELSKLLPDLVETLGGEGRTELGLPEDSILAAVATAITREPLPDGIDRIEVRAGNVTISASKPAPHFEGDGPDPMFDQAVELVVGDGKASISYVQRKLRIGYNRAARLLEEMEKQGIVSRMDAVGGRQVLKREA